MTTPELQDGATTNGIAISPSLGPTLEDAGVTRHSTLVDQRVLLITFLSILIAVAASIIAVILMRLIGLITNISFYGTLSTNFISPAGNHLGVFVLIVPAIGGIIVGLMARYGHQAIRGHGIPEAMEQVLFNESKIPKRITLFKPLSAAISIGTGGPFGAEGPIIATGGALGSLVGQLLKVMPHERKTLLAAGAAAGMTATFGSPVSAVLLAIELLLFEFRPRSFVPVALASATAAGMRYALVGGGAVFAMPDVAQQSGSALFFYAFEGVVIGLFSVLVTKIVYFIEDAFERLPIHWMWWPALGGLIVGLVGYFSPKTMGVGYDNIELILTGTFLGGPLLFFCLMKFVSWSLALGSGTSGGTLAPLFTIGGALGAALGATVSHLAPGAAIDIRVAALVGMAALFAGASRALLASIIFAFETTKQTFGLLPLLAGCTTSFTLSAMVMRETIMTEKIARRGRHVPSELVALEHQAQEHSSVDSPKK